MKSDKPISCCAACKPPKRRKIKHINMCLTKAQSKRVSNIEGYNKGWRGKGTPKKVTPIE